MNAAPHDRAPLPRGRLRATRVATIAIAAQVIGLLIAGCTVVGPDYERPASTLPASYDSATPGTPAGDPLPQAPSDWWPLFSDPQLSALVDTALAQNTDIQVAVARIEEADALLRETGAAFLPSVNLTGLGARSQTSALTPLRTPSLLANNLVLTASASYEIDFWGRLRRSEESARALALASRYASDVVRLSVAGLTAQTWFSLRSLDEQIALTQRTLEARDQQLRIVRLRLDAGTASRLDLEQASGARADAAIQLRDLQRQRELAQSLLGRITGQPGLQLPSRRDATGDAGALSAMPVPPSPPPGLPSDLLMRRPDLRQAEEELVSANAQIGVARAAMLPSISLTGLYGAQSTALATLLDSGARIWTLGFGLSLPLFDGGRLEARADQASARQRQALAGYQGAAQSAFREVSDALIASRAASDAEADVLARAQATRRSLQLALMRYESGYSGYLEVLDAQRSANAAELDAVRNRQARLNAAVDLFKALSGGWPDEQPGAARAR